jgi:hypothetical protein
MVLVLKLVLVPGLVASASLAERRWGPRIAGLLTSFPIVTGPVLVFFAIEQGDAFTAEASRGALVALVAVAGSGLAYAWTSLGNPWWISLGVSWTTFTVLTLALRGTALAAPWALAVALASFTMVRTLLPASPGPRAPLRRSSWDLPFRTIAAMLVVLSVTGFGRRLGPTLSGAFTPFPVALGVLLAFTHAQGGPSSAIQFLRGFVPGMWSFAVFCFVAAVAVVPCGSAAGLLLALAAVVPIQAAVLWRMQRAAALADRLGDAPQTTPS